jgi:hypothetical protein
MYAVCPERLRQVGLREPRLHLPRVVLVPALVRRPGVATPEVLGLRVAAGVGRLPVGEAVVALDARGVLVGPLAVPVDRFGQVPLALDRDVVAALAQERREVVDPRRQLRLLAGVGTETQQSAREGPREPSARDGAAHRQVARLAQHVGRVARIGVEVVLGHRQRHPVARRVLPGEEARAARRAHRGGGERARKAHPGPAQLGVVGHEPAEPAVVRRPVHRRALLVGDEEYEIGWTVGHGRCWQ